MYRETVGMFLTVFVWITVKYPKHQRNYKRYC